MSCETGALVIDGTDGYVYPQKLRLLCLETDSVVCSQGEVTKWLG
jgi:hypothetical protein